MAVDRVSSTQRGGATAVFQMAWDLGGFLGGPILGAVGSVIDVETIFWAASAGAVLALAGATLRAGDGLDPAVATADPDSDSGASRGRCGRGRLSG